MPRGGKRPGAGRKRGSKTKKTQKLLEEVRSGGETPLDYMLRVMRDQKADNSRRDDMAKAAAPYTHSRLPTAIVTPPSASGSLPDDDEAIVDLYMAGLHAEADEE
jgi:hypothetical protein